MKRFWTGRTLRPIQFGIVSSIVAAMLLFLTPATLLDEPRELFFDMLTRWEPADPVAGLTVVDIDRKAASTVATGQWTRADTARVVEAIAAAKPAVIAFDLIFSGNCAPDNADNKALAEALGLAPTVLGFLLADREGDPPFPRPPLVAEKGLVVPAAWFVEGTEAACPVFAEKAASAAGAFLFGDHDARVRRVQAFSIYKGAAYPALAIEAVRIAGSARVPPVLSDTPLMLRIGARKTSLAEDGNLRFAASGSSVISARTVSAADVMSGKVAVNRIAGKIVFIGSSLPNLGGLRATASMPLEASVQIHADLASGFLQQRLPHRDARFVRYEALSVLFAGIAIALAAAFFRPVGIAVVGFLIAGLAIASSWAIYALSGLLIDGFSVALALLCVLTVTTFFQFARVRAAERKARDRFGQYLPKSVVERYLDAPDDSRLAGDARDVTALFTDIEGFSALSRTISAQQLVALLDIYFAEVNALVAEHGGMVDKVVGDAVHALFNAPENLDDHVNRAIACALDIRDLTEAMRKRPEFSACSFGRTRIGLETGPAVLGEIGAGGKLDYTAHGPAVNLAARLQDANKVLGTSICIGPQAGSQSRFPLKSLGYHEIRDFGSIALFTVED